MRTFKAVTVSYALEMRGDGQAQVDLVAEFHVRRAGHLERSAEMRGTDDENVAGAIQLNEVRVDDAHAVFLHVGVVLSPELQRREAVAVGRPLPRAPRYSTG
jgi:hypothetical protein